MDCSMPGFPVHHQLPELPQTHVQRVGDAIKPSLLTPPPAVDTHPSLVSELDPLGTSQKWVLIL